MYRSAVIRDITSIRLNPFTMVTVLLIGFMLSVILPNIQSAQAIRNTQQYGYTKTIGGDDYNEYLNAEDVITDSAGNIYLSGEFTDTVNFNPNGLDERTSIDFSSDIFITKINADGSYGYTKTIAGPGWNYGTSLAIDSNDNLYIAGQFGETANFNSDGLDEHTAASFDGDGQDIFLTKINADGSYGWTKTIAENSNDPAGLAIDSADNIYLAGNFRLTVNFNPDGVDEHTSVGSNDIFLTKFNADGSYSYTKTMGGTSQDINQRLTTDLIGNVYLTGSFQGTANFNPDGTDNHISAGSRDIFLTKINADGSYGYTKTMGGTGVDMPWAAATDSIGNIYLTGRFQGTSNFNSDGIDTHISAGGDDVFLTKISADGSYGYTKTMGGTGWDAGYDVSVDSFNNIYLLGVFRSTANFNSDGVDERTSLGASDIFLTKINADGSYGYTKTMGGDDGDYGYAVTTDAANNIYITGTFWNTVNFNPEGDDEHTMIGSSNDIFLTKLASVTAYHVTNLTPGLKAMTITGTSVDDEEVDEGILAGETTGIRLTTDSDVPIADVVTDFNSDLNWSEVAGDSDSISKKSYVHNIVSAPGTTTSYSLYVPYGTEGDSVAICPNATSLEQVTPECSDVIIYTETDDTVSITTIEDIDYWKIDNLTGTGGISFAADAEQPPTTDPEASDSATTSNDDSPKSDLLADTGDNVQLLMLLAIMLICSGAVLVKKQSNRSLPFRTKI